MRKKLVVSLLSMGCGVNSGDEQPVSGTQVEDTPKAEEPKVEEETPTDNGIIFQEYTAGLKDIAGSSFKMNAVYEEEDGYASFGPSIEGESGNLCWIYGADNKFLITVDYESTTNKLSVNSLKVSADGKVEVADTESFDEFIFFDDDLDVLMSEITLPNGKDTLMIESRGLAYSYADGVSYGIKLIQIGEDGSLDTYYDDGLAGSGDEDITSEIRSSFNSAAGTSYDQDTMEDAFYNGNLLIKQENKPVLASLTFKSDSGKLADDEDWEGANEITSKVYALMDSKSGQVYWGEGEFGSR